MNDTSPDSSITLNNDMPKRGSKHVYDLVPKKKSEVIKLNLIEGWKSEGIVLGWGIAIHHK